MRGERIEIVDVRERVGEHDAEVREADSIGSRTRCRIFACGIDLAIRPATIQLRGSLSVN